MGRTISISTQFLEDTYNKVRKEAESSFPADLNMNIFDKLVDARTMEKIFRQICLELINTKYYMEAGSAFKWAIEEKE